MGLGRIEALEDRLAEAMVAGDVGELDLLIDDAMIFTGPDGNILGKADDLALHREQILKLSLLKREDHVCHAMGDLIVVATRARLAGRFAGADFAGVFAYTRVWRLSSLGWRVIAGHSARIGDS
jgi:Domain of unknown function (DUF4440)